MRALAVGLAIAGWGTVAPAEPPPRFPAAAVWHQNISAALPHSQSASMIATLAGLGGFGNGRMQIDFSLHIVHAGAGDPTRTIADVGGYYLPDCEPLGTSLPVPLDAAIEGHGDLDCNAAGGEDCHLLVVQGQNLYEVYAATENGAGAGSLLARCLAVWRLDVIYPPQGRGEHCTSADAAGFPIAPLLFNADEIAAALAVDATGDTVDLGHAIRFILPNGRMASDDDLGGEDGKLYVRPATHAGDPSGPAGSVPYGSRLRLIPGFPRTGYNPAARVLLNTFERFGIVLADGGTIALTAESDLYTTAKWDDLGVDSRIFDLTPGATDVAIGHFEVLDTGARIPETYECVRTNPLPTPTATLDIDGNGEVEPLTDGVLVLRYLFGYRGATLLTGAVDLAGCRRCSADPIESYLAALSD